jgi:hypothetical protein
VTAPDLLSLLRCEAPLVRAFYRRLPVRVVTFQLSMPIAKNQAISWGRDGLCWRSPPGRRENSFYMLGGVVLAVGVCPGAGVALSPVVFVIRRTSTRRFFARPSEVLLESTGLSLPNPIR